jgi:hypothetical protein
MDKQKFSHYIDCFNRSDFAGFGRYYADDVVGSYRRRSCAAGTPSWIFTAS